MAFFWYFSFLIFAIIMESSFVSAGSERWNGRGNSGNVGNNVSVSIPEATTTTDSQSSNSHANVNANANANANSNVNVNANVNANANSNLYSSIIQEQISPISQSIPLMVTRPEEVTSPTSRTSRILVRYLDGASEITKSLFSKHVGMNKVKEMRNRWWELYEVSASRVPQEVLNKILEQRGTLISQAEMDILVPSHIVPNDPLFSNQWHHKIIGSEQAWTIQPSSDIIVAVADTGVDRYHPDLQNNTLLTGYNTVKNNNDDTDTVWHGTSVIGSIAAVWGNTVGVVGTAYQSKILPIKITGDGLSSAYLSDIGEAVAYADNAGAKIINISFGPLCGSSYFHDAAASMRQNGGLVVVSAGNDGQEAPCSDTPSVIYVSATDKNNTKTSWSTYGKFVDIAAPGESITTTTMGGSYGSVSGTSFSSPIVAGSLALLWSKNPTLNNDTIESIIKKTALDRGDTWYDSLYGAGVLSSIAALSYGITDDTPTPTPPTPDPTIPGKDTEAPVFTSFSHTDGAIINPRGTLRLSVDTTDNVGTAEITITFDGMTVAHCYNSYNCRSFPFNTRRMLTGDHTVTFIARDAAGNEARETIIMQKHT